MSELTKNAIIHCTMELAKKQPINKITVRDITESCGISRNTFYYYFHDIFDVFDQLLEAHMENFLNDGGDLESALFKLIEFTAQNKKVWLNLYKSVGHSQLSAITAKRIHQHINKLIQSEFPDHKMSAQDLEIICAFYEEALFGILVRWLFSGREESPEEVRSAVERIRILFAGQLELLINNSVNNPI